MGRLEGKRIIVTGGAGGIGNGNGGHRTRRIGNEALDDLRLHDELEHRKADNQDSKTTGHRDKGCFTLHESPFCGGGARKNSNWGSRQPSRSFVRQIRFSQMA
jgi:hypothetical protein